MEDPTRDPWTDAEIKAAFADADNDDDDTASAIGVLALSLLQRLVIAVETIAANSVAKPAPYSLHPNDGGVVIVASRQEDLEMRQGVLSRPR